MFKFENGDVVRDKISGFEGIIIARVDWLYGCKRYTVQTRGLKDGKPIETQGFDEDQVEFVSKAQGLGAGASPDRGGPRDVPSRPADPSR